MSDNQVEALRQRILSAPAPLGRGCCGAGDVSDCHQRGICWMRGSHPDSPGYEPNELTDELVGVPGAEAPRLELANIRRLLERHGVAPADGHGEVRSTVAMVEEALVSRPPVRIAR